MCMYFLSIRAINFGIKWIVILQVACFPFQGSNCPPLQLVSAFCEAAYAWLKEGLENVVVVHCKGGMARTGLMISCLLLHLKVCASPCDFSKRHIDSILDALCLDLIT